MSVTCYRSVDYSGYFGFLSNKTDCRDISEILLKVALNTINHKTIDWLNYVRHDTLCDQNIIYISFLTLPLLFYILIIYSVFLFQINRQHFIFSPSTIIVFLLIVLFSKNANWFITYIQAHFTVIIFCRLLISETWYLFVFVCFVFVVVVVVVLFCYCCFFVVVLPWMSFKPWVQ